MVGQLEVIEIVSEKDSNKAGPDWNVIELTDSD